MKRKLVLSNATSFIGEGFGSAQSTKGMIVFNTMMQGYQEVLSDPSNKNLIMVMSYPLIGNYGITDEDYESKIISPKALIVKEYNDKPSNFRYTKTLNELLEENNVVGLTHVDTRALVNEIRESGPLMGMIVDCDVDEQEVLLELKKVEEDYPVNDVSCKKIWYSRCANPQYNVVVIDYGVRYSIIKKLNAHGCNVTMVPHDTSAQKIRHLCPDGIVISNGPGNPNLLSSGIQVIKDLSQDNVLFGISLGHQLCALAFGHDVVKMKHDHRGNNHPVIQNESGKIKTVNENHGYKVVLNHTQDRVTHQDLLDQTIEGLSYANTTCISLQFNPTVDDFQPFIDLIKTKQGEQNNA